MNDRMTMWIRSYGTTKLARDLGTGRLTVHSWTNSVIENRVTPSADFMRSMIRLSRETPFMVGPLKYEDFLGEA